jgi:hypothetical protein
MTRLACSLCIGTTGSPVPCKSLSQFTPLISRMPSAGLQDFAQTYPGVALVPARRPTHEAEDPFVGLNSLRRLCQGSK